MISEQFSDQLFAGDSILTYCQMWKCLLSFEIFASCHKSVEIFVDMHPLAIGSELNQVFFNKDDNFGCQIVQRSSFK